MLINFEKFEKDMAAFSFKQHQDVLTYLLHLETKGWTLEDAQSWIEAKRLKLQTKQTSWASFQCPICQASMQLLSVNVSPATQTNDDSKSVWLCANKECMHTIYNKESLQEILKKGGK